MTKIKTNKDLYLFGANLDNQFAKAEISLHNYLRSIWELGKEVRNLPGLKTDEFAALLEKAFLHKPVYNLPDNHCDETESLDEKSSFQAWENTVLCQIIGLNKLENARAYNNELRYFGVDLDNIECAKCKSNMLSLTWYNFDPFTFIECGLAGTFGGWKSEDGYQDEIKELEMITWEAFMKFLICGQIYE